MTETDAPFTLKIFKSYLGFSLIPQTLSDGFDYPQCVGPKIEIDRYLESLRKTTLEIMKDTPESIQWQGMNGWYYTGEKALQRINEEQEYFDEVYREMFKYPED